MPLVERVMAAMGFDRIINRIEIMCVMSALRTSVRSENPTVVRLAEVILWAHNPDTCDVSELVSFCSDGDNDEIKRLCFFISGSVHMDYIFDAYKYVCVLARWLHQIPVSRVIERQCMSLSPWRLFFYRLADLYCVNADEVVICNDCMLPHIQFDNNNTYRLPDVSLSSLHASRRFICCKDGDVVLHWAHTCLCFLTYKDLKVIISVKDGEKHSLIPKVPYSEPVNARIPQIMIRFGSVVREVLEQHETCTIVWSKMHKLRHKPSFLPESLSDDMLKIKSVPALTDKDIRISADMGMVSVAVLSRAWNEIKKSVC